PCRSAPNSRARRAPRSWSAYRALISRFCIVQRRSRSLPGQPTLSTILIVIFQVVFQRFDNRLQGRLIFPRELSEGAPIPLQGTGVVTRSQTDIAAIPIVATIPGHVLSCGGEAKAQDDDARDGHNPLSIQHRPAE